MLELWTNVGPSPVVQDVLLLQSKAETPLPKLPIKACSHEVFKLFRMTECTWLNRASVNTITFEMDSPYWTQCSAHCRTQVVKIHSPVNKREILLQLVRIKRFLVHFVRKTIAPIPPNPIGYCKFNRSMSSYFLWVLQSVFRWAYVGIKRWIRVIWCIDWVSCQPNFRFYWVN